MADATCTDQRAAYFAAAWFQNPEVIVNGVSTSIISGPWIGNRLMAVIKELGLCQSLISSVLRLSFRQN